MAVGKSRRLIYVSIAVAAAVILILAVILLQQPIQNKTTPPPSKTAPAVTTILASGVGTTTATLNGKLWDLGSASHSLVGFLFGTDPSLSAATNDTVANETAANAFDEAMSGLSPDTAYYFRAWALGDGFSVGSVETFTTLSPNVPQSRGPSVDTDAANSVNTSAAMLNGNLTDLGTATSVTVGFRYGTSASLASATNLSAGTLSTVGDFGAQVSGLTANTTYYVQAWAAGAGFATGSVLSFTTAASSGNGHQVPPGWSHAACPNVPPQAVAHGVRARCEAGMTWGQLKKSGGLGALPAAIALIPSILGPVSVTSPRDRRGTRGGRGTRAR